MAWRRSRDTDPVAAQLRDLERQGTLGAHIAHVLAYLLILLFSLGSLVALGGDALQHAIAGWQRHTLDVPALIALAVTTLLVPAMDAAMLYAASMLRLLTSRRADTDEMRLHKWVIIGVSFVEAATYGYMSWKYEQPADAVAWGLIAARALASPLLSIYLSMARPLPVTPRDILYRVEFATGLGLIRDAVRIANDDTAEMARKWSLYGASAVMTPADRSRLGEMIAVMESIPSQPPLVALPTPAKTPKAHAVTHDHSRPPTGPGSPATAHTLRTPPAQADSALAAVIDETPDYDEEEESSRVVHINRSRSARNVNKRLRREGKQARRTRIRDTVNMVLDQADEAGEVIDDIAINELARRVNAALSAAGDDVNTSPATVKHHRTNWLRSRQSAAVQ